MMQNRNKTLERKSSLPCIKSRKYNQSNSSLDEKQSRLVTYPRPPQFQERAIMMVREKQNTNDKYEQNMSSMRKLKKIFNGDREKTKNSSKNYGNKTYVGSIYNESYGQAMGRFDMNLGARKVNTREKPPHRYKTTMLIFKHCLLLYGGLGCEKYLTWARLGFERMNWEIPKYSTEIKPINTYMPFTPIYGHTMCKYLDSAIVYGGCCSDQINETTLINTKTMEITQGSRCPFRRKQHAAVVLGELMIVHGGIEAREVKSEIFVYFITQDKWNSLINVGLPALAGHKIVKGKNNRELYMFGGLNSKYKSTNKLYKIKISGPEVVEIKWQQVDSPNAPNPRHSFCLEKLSNNIMLLYGGREDNETDYQEQGIEKGVFNDIHIYNMEKKLWRRIQPSMSFDYCFGMASTSSHGTVFIYGGSNHTLYADASINVLWNNEERSDPWESVQRSEMEICSSKKVSNKLIAL